MAEAPAGAVTRLSLQPYPGSLQQDDLFRSGGCIINKFCERARSVTTEPKFHPLDIQIRAAELLRSTGRGIAVLPTGAGKTLLAALPFATGLLTPRQMVFMTPLRSLTGAQAGALSRSIKPEAARSYLGAPWDVREQYRGSPGDPLYEASVVVSTFDQALSAAAAISYSTSRRRRNINAGAVLGAYLVADEIHLYPREQALLTLLWLLKHRPDLPFLLMTATLSRPMADRLANLLGAAVLSDLSDADLKRLKVEERVRTVLWCSQPIDAHLVQSQLARGKKVLVVVNTVDRAIELGQEIEKSVDSRDPMLVLHSRFYGRDRSDKEQRLQETFGKEPTDDRLRIVVATQVVEAGLDISADVLLTELAPANALVQRWGRVARWGGVGEVIVASPPGDRVRPYDDPKTDGPELLRLTREWLEENAREPITMDTRTERELLNHVHASADERWLDELEENLRSRGQELGKVIEGGDYSAAGRLIRHVDNRTLLVHGNPKGIEDPTRYEGFGVSVGRLYRLMGEKPPMPDMVDEEDDGGWMPPISDVPEAPEWALQVPIYPNDESREGRQVPTWDKAQGKTLASFPIVAVNPKLVTYDPFYGLSFTPAEEPTTDNKYWSQPRVGTASHFARTPSRLETLEEHVGRILSVYERDPSLLPRLETVAPLVEAWCEWSQGMLDRVVRAAIVTHDAGKLVPVWQKYIREYQKKHGNPVKPWMVHSDDPKRPLVKWKTPVGHALSGAAHGVGVGRALDREVQEWRAARNISNTKVLPSHVLFSAVAMHHTPDIECWELSGRELLEDPGREELTRLLMEHGLPGELPARPPRSSLDAYTVNFLKLGGNSDTREWLALALVIRALRLADGWSQDPERLKRVAVTD